MLALLLGLAAILPSHQVAQNEAPISTPDRGAAALADPNGNIGRNLDSHSVLIKSQVPVYANAGRLRMDSTDPGTRQLPCEAADILRRDMNARVFAPATAMIPDLDAFLTRARNSAKRADSEFADTYGDTPAGTRMDAATEGGTVLARQLEAVWKRVLDMPRPPLLGPQLFPINTDAGPGQESIRIDRFLDRQVAVMYNGGTSPIPTGSMRQVSTHVQFRHIVSASQWTLLDQLAWNVAGIPGVQRSLANARRAIEELWDQIIWNGSVVHGLYGVLNYPYLSRKIVGTTFSPSADPDDMISAFMGLITYVSETSNGAALPDSVLISTKLANFMESQRVDAISSTSLLDYLRSRMQSTYEMAGGTGKFNVRAVARLNDVGGTGVHGVFVYKKDPDAISLPLAQPTTLLPLFQNGMSFNQVAYMTMAGVVMPNAFNNLIGLITLTTA